MVNKKHYLYTISENCSVFIKFSQISKYYTVPENNKSISLETKKKLFYLCKQKKTISQTRYHTQEFCVLTIALLSNNFIFLEFPRK